MLSLNEFFYLEKVDGDGNCFYYAVSLFLSENPDHIRNTSVEYMEQNKMEFLEFFLDNEASLNKYIEKAKKNNTYVDNPDVFALSQAYNRTVVVNYKDTPPLVFNPQKGNPIFLFHNGQYVNDAGHYSPLILKKDCALDFSQIMELYTSQSANMRFNPDFQDQGNLKETLLLEASGAPDEITEQQSKMPKIERDFNKLMRESKRFTPKFPAIKVIDVNAIDRNSIEFKLYNLLNNTNEEKNKLSPLLWINNLINGEPSILTSRILVEIVRLLLNSTLEFTEIEKNTSIGDSPNPNLTPDSSESPSYSSDSLSDQTLLKSLKFNRDSIGKKCKKIINELKRHSKANPDFFKIQNSRVHLDSFSKLNTERDAAIELMQIFLLNAFIHLHFISRCFKDSNDKYTSLGREYVNAITDIIKAILLLAEYIKSDFGPEEKIYCINNFFDMLRNFDKKIEIFKEVKDEAFQKNIHVPSLCFKILLYTFVDKLLKESNLIPGIEDEVLRFVLFTSESLKSCGTTLFYFACSVFAERTIYLRHATKRNNVPNTDQNEVSLLDKLKKLLSYLESIYEYIKVFTQFDITLPEYVLSLYEHWVLRAEVFIKNTLKKFPISTESENAILQRYARIELLFNACLHWCKANRKGVQINFLPMVAYQKLSESTQKQFRDLVWKESQAEDILNEIRASSENFQGLENNASQLKSLFDNTNLFGKPNYLEQALNNPKKIISILKSLIDKGILKPENFTKKYKNSIPTDNNFQYWDEYVSQLRNFSKNLIKQQIINGKTKLNAIIDPLVREDIKEAPFGVDGNTILFRATTNEDNFIKLLDRLVDKKEKKEVLTLFSNDDSLLSLIHPEKNNLISNLTIANDTLTFKYKNRLIKFYFLAIQENSPLQLSSENRTNLQLILKFSPNLAIQGKNIGILKMLQAGIQLVDLTCCAFSENLEANTKKYNDLLGYDSVSNSNPYREYLQYFPQSMKNFCRGQCDEDDLRRLQFIFERLLIGRANIAYTIESFEEMNSIIIEVLMYYAENFLNLKAEKLEEFYGALFKAFMGRKSFAFTQFEYKLTDADKYSYEQSQKEQLTQLRSQSEGPVPTNTRARSESYQQPIKRTATSMLLFKPEGQNNASNKEINKPSKDLNPSKIFEPK